MKIDGQNGASSINLRHTDSLNNQGTADQSQNAGKGVVKSFDRIEISPQARQVDRLKKEMATIPEVRLDKVALMKQQLSQGAYRVDPVLVAEKMMDSVRR